MKHLLLSVFFFISVLSQAQLDFVKQISGDYDHTPYCIATDAAGNIYLAGRFAGTTDFDPGSGTALLTSANGSFDLFIAKYDANGNHIWSFGAGDNYQDEIRSMYIDANNDIFLTGSFSGSFDFDFGTGIAVLTEPSPGIYDQFILKLDDDGNFQYVKQIGSNPGGNAYGYGITKDASGNIITTGYFVGTIDADPGTGTNLITAAGGNGDTDSFVLKLNATGNFDWVVRAGNNAFSPEGGKSVVVDSDGYVYAVGEFNSTVDFNPGAGINNLVSAGNSDIYIWKLTPDGNYVNAVNFGSVANDFIKSIHVDVNDHLFLGGYFVMSCDFDPGAGTAVINGGNTYYDGFIVEFDSTLSYVNAGSIDGSTANIYVNDVITDANGDIFAVGRLQGIADADPGNGTFTLTTSLIKEFITKWDSSFGFICATQTESTGSSEGNSITLDANSHILTCGSFSGLIDFNPSTSIDNLSATSALADGYFKKLYCPINTIGMNESELSVSIFPNPTSGIVEIEHDQFDQGTILVNDLSGRLIFTSDFIHGNKYDFSFLDNGMYLITLEKSGIKSTSVLNVVK